MKRLLAVLMVLTMLVVAGCFGSGATTTLETVLGTTTTSAEPEATTTTQESSTTTTVAVAPNEKWETTVELEGLTITVGAPVDDTAKLSKVQKALVAKGNKVMYMMVTIKNTGDQTYSFHPLAFKLSDSEGIQYESLGVVCSQPTLDAGDIRPGRAMKGALPFEMPKKSHPSYIDFLRNIGGDIEATWGD